MGQLRDRMDADLQLRGLSENTRRLYLRCARDFAAYGGRSPAVVGTEEVRAFLRHLVATRRAPSTCGVYAAALRFLSDVTLDRPAVAARMPRRRVPERLPTILSTAEVERLLAAVHSPKHRAILMTAYATGLRVSEIVALRPTDIDSERLLIRVRAGKGDHDRERAPQPPAAHGAARVLARGPAPGRLPLPREQTRAADLPQGRLAHAAQSRGAGRAHQADLAAHAPPLLRHPPARGGHRSAHHPASPRPPLAPQHRALHLRLAHGPHNCRRTCPPQYDYSSRPGRRSSRTSAPSIQTRGRGDRAGGPASDSARSGARSSAARRPGSS
jgi:integrase